MAAERTGRRCYGLEIDPLYVDTSFAVGRHTPATELGTVRAAKLLMKLKWR